jgi:hypothetical protein
MFGTDIPAVWVDYADRSYLITRLIWFIGFMLDAPVNSHRTIELYLKAFLVSQGESAAKGKTAWGHDLKSLTEKCARYNADFSIPEFIRRVVYFQRYFDMVRYPSDPNLSDKDGMIWFSFDSCIAPLDEIVAFVRPRIRLSEDEWRRTTLNSVFSMSNPTRGYQRKALTDANDQINILICEKTFRPTVLFNPAFNFDLPGC